MARDAKPRSPIARSPLHARSQLRPGLRLQIVMALAGLMLLAFGPLFFAVASLARITASGARQESARAVGRAVAAHLNDAQGASQRDPSAEARALRSHVGPDVDAICILRRGDSAPLCEGAPLDVAAMRPSRFESMRVLRGDGGRVLEIGTPIENAVVITQVHLDAGRVVPLVRPVALYMTVFGLALLVFAYFALTRLIVRPVDHLVEAADRVASGARTLRVPGGGPREIVELGASFQAMAEKLIAEESALLLKVRELTETTTQLTQTQAQLVRSERMASVGRLAAGLAHEIGNPVAALIGMLDLVLPGDLPPDVERDFLRRMRGETERIHTVVRDLLDFARPEEIQLIEGASPPPADVRMVIDDVVGLVRPQKGFQGVQLEIRVDGPLRVTLAAPRLTQVLLNLVLNAGAAIASLKRQGKIVLHASAVQGGHVRIVVEDDGPGIASAVRDRLFEPFVTTKAVGEGTGLGLAVCRGLVESAGGEIGVDPSRVRGARFFLVLPSAPA
jgi:two-component system NtrC family sensor kinase